MASSLPRVARLYFHATAVFDTGFIFDFETMAGEARHARALASHLNAHHTEFAWQTAGTSYRLAGTVDNFSPPRVSSTLSADLTQAMGQTQISLPLSEGRTVACQLSEVRAHFYLFNAGVVHFRLDVPAESWNDVEALKRLRFFLQLHQHDAGEFGTDVETLLGPAVARMKRALEEAVRDTSPPLLDTPFLDFSMLVGAAGSEVRWSHATLVAVMDEPFDLTGEHFQPVLLDLNPEGVQNFSSLSGQFAYVESGDSLVIVPGSDDLGRTPEALAFENWLQWIGLHHYTWKMAWELDRGLFAVLAAATNTLKHKRRSTFYRDVYALNALLNFVWLLFDTHKPRNMTTAYHCVHFLERMSKSWRTDEIIAAANEKMAALREVIAQLDELEDNLRTRRFDFFLTFLGIFSLGSLVLDVLGALSFGDRLGDLSIVGLVAGTVALFVAIALYVMR